jgi:tRNA(fMet)-specific endonuclease VapC
VIVLDTSAIIDFTRGNKQLVEVIKTADNSGQIVAVTSVSFFELFTPIFHKNMAKKERVLRAFLGKAPVLTLDQAASEESARIMSALLKIGRPINVLDVLIAGIAAVNNAELLIGSDTDFNAIAKVTSLRIRVL